MKNLLLTLFLGSLIFTAHGQLISLDDKEIAALKSALQQTEHVKLKNYLSQSSQNFLGDQPNPIDTIRTEGLLRGNPKKVKTQAAMADMNKMLVLALQYRLTSADKYLYKTIDFLIAWAKVNKANGDPIDDTGLEPMLMAYDLVKNNMPDTSKAIVDFWLKETATAEINSKRMKPGRATAINNWNAHRLKIVGEIGYTLGNRQFIAWTIAELKQHIQVNLNADGTSIDFLERDAMHYHIYDLQPLLRLAIVIKRAGDGNFYTYQSPKGSSIKKSVAWLLPYIKGEKQHEEYVHTTVKFDHDRAKNNEPGFAPGTMFEPKLALPVLELAVYFDETYAPILKQLEPVNRNLDALLLSIQKN